VTVARLFVIAVSLLVFGGCVVKGPEVRVGAPTDVKSEGRFCPPGQAKKGNC
jgi:hypothetical protein